MYSPLDVTERGVPTWDELIMTSGELFPEPGKLFHNKIWPPTV